MRRPRLTAQRYQTLRSALAYLEAHAEAMDVDGDTAEARKLYKQVESATEWLYKTAELSDVEVR